MLGHDTSRGITCYIVVALALCWLQLCSAGRSILEAGQHEPLGMDTARTEVRSMSVECAVGRKHRSSLLAATQEYVLSTLVMCTGC